MSNEAKKKAVLEWMDANEPNMTKACEALGLHYQTTMKWQQKDLGFKKAVLKIRDNHARRLTADQRETVKAMTKRQRQIRDMPKAKKKVLKEMRVRATLREACAMARVNYRKVCLWVTRDPVFKAELAAAKVEQEDFLREVLHERAVTGREKPVIYRGEVVYLRDPVTGDFILNDDFEPQMLTENQVSDKLLERMLDARLPEYAKAKGDGTGGRVDAVVNVRFVAPPQDWETVEWDEEGRPKGARVIDAEAKEVDAEASDREADTGEVPEPVQAG